MLRFVPLAEHTASPAHQAALLRQFRAVLASEGMASMDEYGDMLKWALPGQADGWCRYFHVFHPGWCSFSDAFYGTIHDHGGEIRGTVLAGAMEHYTYEPEPDPEGDRFYQGAPYRLTKHTNLQSAATAYSLQPRVPHWLKPLELTITYFEEEDNGVMGDLLNPTSTEPDTHLWEQDDAEQLLPELHALIDARLSALELAA